MSKNVPEYIYYMHTPLFVLDTIRMFQDHPKYKNGLDLPHIVDIFKQERFATGDLESQIQSAIKTLETSGFVRYIDTGYRTLGPWAKIATARTPRQKKVAWEEIQRKLF